nr:uncharacterized protein LOC127298572 [Lolium perenne]
MVARRSPRHGDGPETARRRASVRRRRRVRTAPLAAATCSRLPDAGGLPAHPPAGGELQESRQGRTGRLPWRTRGGTAGAGSGGGPRRRQRSPRPWLPFISPWRLVVQRKATSRGSAPLPNRRPSSSPQSRASRPPPIPASSSLPPLDSASHRVVAAAEFSRRQRTAPPSSRRRASATLALHQEELGRGTRPLHALEGAAAKSARRRRPSPVAFDDTVAGTTTSDRGWQEPVAIQGQATWASPRFVQDIESPDGRSLSSTAASSTLGDAGGLKGKHSWKQKSIVTVALTLLTSSQAILIVWSKRAGKYEYSVTTAN